MRRKSDDPSLKAAHFIDAMLRPFGFGDRWAFHSLFDNGEWYGMSEAHVRGLYASAELIINLHGGTEPLPEHYETGRLVYLETDPVQVQLELERGDLDAIEYLRPHCAYFTFAENYRHPESRLPVSDRFDFRPTRQPVVLDFWTGRSPSTRLFTTIGNWQQLWRELERDGEIYSWSKDVEFRKVIDLPRRTGEVFELALGSVGSDDKRFLVDHGWRLCDPAAISGDPDAYRDYILASAAEFTVAKDQNVRFRTGWFSDRSATYLAAGRPVVTQDTGFGQVIPTGEGLFAFSTVDEAAAAVEAIRGDYPRHARAASEIAREYFDSARVLGNLLEQVGAPRVASALSLRVVSRRPTRLLEESERAVLSAPLPPRIEAAPPEVGVVIVAADGLPFTRLCLESVLAGVGPALEVVVVDNASSDGTADYLRELADRDHRVRVLRSDENLGFAAGVNRGLNETQTPTLLILNNDVVLPPRAIARLVRHLADSEIGLVGPVSNEASTEAEIDQSWETYAELVAAAAERGRVAEPLLEVDMLTFFCTALRRDVFERVGELDERYEVGLFEDDDYSLRVRGAGFKLAVAEDVLVHHFGEASIGKLVPTGAYADVFEANRHRFEEKWGISWNSHERRLSATYASVLARVQDVAAGAVPPDANVLVVSRGDERLLSLVGPQAQHFPQIAEGAYAGYYPADSAEAIAQLEDLRAAGAEYLLLPTTSFWWLDHYAGFRQHLEQRYSRAADDEACVIYGLNGSNTGG
jgi:GT2 family glycosyltransferase